jgi:hypothetical protein
MAFDSPLKGIIRDIYARLPGSAGLSSWHQFLFY